MRHIMFHVFILVSLVGCTSNMSVQVDIFDPKGVNPDDAIESTAQREAAKHAFALKRDLYGQASVDLKGKIYEYLKSLAQLDIVSSGDIPTLQNSASEIIDQQIGEAIQKRNEGMEDTRKAETIIDASDRRNKFQTALQSFQSATVALTNLRTMVLSPFEGPITAFTKPMKKENVSDLSKLNKIINIKTQVDTAIEKNLASLTGGFGLFDDPLASAIISAPDNNWKGVYNKTAASGSVGNTDIAIKMETIGTFTIKGLRLDASKATVATFEVLKQSVRMVAAAYGVPIPDGGPPATSGDTSSTSPSDMLLTVDQARQSADRKRQLSRNAALTLLDIIVSEQIGLNSGDNGIREAAVRRVKQAFDAYKPQLQGE